MKVVIAGSREGVSYSDVKTAIEESGFVITEVVSGTARGVDRLGEQWANKNNITVKPFPADWNTYGKRAGYLRNTQMADYADALIAVWDGESRGTKHMIEEAKRKGLEWFVHLVKQRG